MKTTYASIKAICSYISYKKILMKENENNVNIVSILQLNNYSAFPHLFKPTVSYDLILKERDTICENLKSYR